MDPGNYMTRNLLGQAYRAVGRNEDASREFAAGQRLQAANQPKLENMH
jgi:Flp pilus assembly protein TadD